MQYNTVQCNAIQCSTIQYNTLQYNTIQYITIQYITIHYNTIRYNAIKYNTIKYNAMRHCAVQFSTVQLHNIPLFTAPTTVFFLFYLLQYIRTHFTTQYVTVLCLQFSVYSTEADIIPLQSALHRCYHHSPIIAPLSILRMFCRWRTFSISCHVGVIQ